MSIRFSNRIARFRRHWLAGCACIALTAGGACPALADDPGGPEGPAAGEPETRTLSFDIPAQDLKSALRQWSAVTGRDWAHVGASLDGLRSSAVTGTLTETDSLTRLLAGTDLTFRILPTGGISLVQARAEGPAEDAVPVDAAAAQGTDEKQDVIIVTGSMIRGAAPSGAQILVIDREEIARTGLGTTEDVIHTLPVNFAGGPNELSSLIGTNDVNGNQNAALASGVNFRGLGADSTLTLVNGRRMAFGGGIANVVDISLLPLAAIERIEALPDGGSATYGADAVGGVVNIILREDYEGAETHVRYGTVTDGNLDEYQAGQVVGTTWDDGNVLVAYEYRKRGNLGVEDRPIVSQDLRPFGGSDWRGLFSTSTGSNPGTIFAPLTGTPYAIPEGQDGTALVPGDFTPGTINLQDGRLRTDVLPEQEEHSVYYTVTQEMWTGVELFLEGRFSSRSYLARDQAHSTFLPLTPAHPFYVDPAGGQPFVIVNYSFLDDLGPQLVTGDVRDYSATVGANIDLGGSWQAEIYGLYGHEDVEARIDNRVNLRLLNEALGLPAFSSNFVFLNPLTPYDPTVDGYFNPLGDGSHTDPAVIDALRGFNEQNTTSTLWAANAKADGVLMALPGGNMRAALGVHYRRETLEGEDADFSNEVFVDPDTLEIGPLVTPVGGGERDVVAGFGELFIPVVGPGNALPGVERFDISVSGRYEAYYGAGEGDTLNVKLGGAWTPVESVRLRGTFGTAYRAPLLRELNDELPGENVIFVTPLPDGGGTTTTLVKRGQNSDLDPEEATIWTAGADLLQPDFLPGLNIALTWFDINFTNRIDAISGLDLFTALLNEDRLGPVITRNPDLAFVEDAFNDPRFVPGPFLPGDVEAFVDARLNNIGKTRVRGLDFMAAYSFDLGRSAIDARVHGSWLVDFQEALTENIPLLENVGIVEHPPELEMRNSVSWKLGGFTATAFINYTSGFFNPNVAPNPPHDVESWTTADLTLSYSLGKMGSDPWFKDVVFTVSVQNLFDEDPPFVDNFTGAGFDPTNASPLGRFIAFQIGTEW